MIIQLSKNLRTTVSVVTLLAYSAGALSPVLAKDFGRHGLEIESILTRSHPGLMMPTYGKNKSQIDDQVVIDMNKLMFASREAQEKIPGEDPFAPQILIVPPTQTPEEVVIQLDQLMESTETIASPLSIPAPDHSTDEIVIQIDQLNDGEDPRKPHYAPSSSHYDLEAGLDWLEKADAELKANPKAFLEVVLNNQVPFEESMELLFKYHPTTHRALHDAGIIDGSHHYHESKVYKAASFLLDALLLGVFHEGYKRQIKDKVLIDGVLPLMRYFGNAMGEKIIEQVIDKSESSAHAALAKILEHPAQTGIKAFLYQYAAASAESVTDRLSYWGYRLSQSALGQIKKLFPASKAASLQEIAEIAENTAMKKKPLQVLWNQLLENPQDLKQAELNIFRLSPKAHWIFDQDALIHKTNANAFWNSYAWKGLRTVGWLTFDVGVASVTTPLVSMAINRLVSNILIAKVVVPTADYVAEYLTEQASNVDAAGIISMAKEYAYYVPNLLSEDMKKSLHSGDWILWGMEKLGYLNPKQLLRNTISLYYKDVGIKAADSIVTSAGQMVIEKVNNTVAPILEEKMTPSSKEPRRSDRIKKQQELGTYRTKRMYDPESGQWVPHKLTIEKKGAFLAPAQ